MSANYRKILETTGMPAVIPEGCVIAMDTNQEPPKFYYYKRSTGSVVEFTPGIQLLDEDDMSSNSPTKAPSQQSVVAYVAAQIAGGVVVGGSFNSDANWSAATIDYKAIGEHVQLRAELTSGTPATQTNIATTDPIPVDYRPSARHRKSVPFYDDSAGQWLTATLIINTDGTINYFPPAGVTTAVSDIISISVSYIK